MKELGACALALLVAGCTFRVEAVDVDSSGAADLAVGDGPAVDLALDGAVPDLAAGDFAMPDLATPPDLTPDPCAPAPAPVANTLVAACSIGAAPVIDGDLSDWPLSLFSTTIAHRTAGVETGGTWSGSEVQNDRNLSADVALRWDASALYVALHVNDDTRRTPNLALFQDDAVELYLDGANDRGPYAADDFQLVFAADGRGELYQNGPSLPLPAGVIAQVKNGATTANWTLEAAVPWSVLTGSPALGRLLGFDVQLDDNDSGGANSDRFIVWKNSAPAACNCAGTRCEPYCDTRPFYTVQLGGR